ncbi:hypothetical protein [Cellulosimicrobium protaetiae]|nr:hypothetical protein [Cellulosimicrobium protaetiae]
MSDARNVRLAEQPLGRVPDAIGESGWRLDVPVDCVPPSETP